MRALLPIVVLGGMTGILAGCASLETYHNACFGQNQTFSAEYNCVKANLVENKAIRSDPMTQEYLATGAVLERKLKNREISEEEARLALIQTLNQIRQREADIWAKEAIASRAWDFPRYTECYRRDSDRLSCYSF